MIVEFDFIIKISAVLISIYSIYFIFNFAIFWKFLFVKNGYVIFEEKLKITFGCTAMFIPGVIFGVIQNYIPNEFSKLFVYTIKRINRRLSRNKTIRFSNIIGVGLGIGIFTGFEFKLYLKEKINLN